MDGMVGRAAPLAELVAMRDEAERGRGRAALILGEAGIGKSTLAEAVAARADGGLVAWGWASPDAPPYAPWRTALDALADDHPLRDPTWLGSTDEDGRNARHALFDAVRAALVQIAAEHGPVLLVLEDVHWADRPSLALLRALADGLRGVPLMVLATARDDPTESAPEVAAALRDLPTSVVRVPLYGLTETELTVMVADVGAIPADVAAALHRRTGGNPFYAREVARLLVAPGGMSAGAIPPGVREALDRRLARLSEPCHRLLGIAAVAAGERDAVDVAMVAEVAGETVVAAMETLDSAVRARLLLPDPIRFAHALVREVVEAGLPASVRGRLHASVAQRLAGSGGAPSAVAAHWLRAVHPDAAAEAGRWSLVAARAAFRQLAFEPAVEAYEQALATGTVDRLDAMVELGPARRLAGDTEGARRTLLDAIADARAQDRPVEFARAALGLGGGIAGFEVSIYDDTQAALLEEAVERLPDEASALRAAVLARLSLMLTGRAPVARRAELASAAVAMARKCGDGATEAAALAAYCDALAGPDHVRARLEAADRSRVRAESVGDRVGVLLARRLRVVALFELGDFVAADTEIEAYEKDADASGAALYRWLPRIWRAARATLRGDLDDARRHIAAADALGKRAGSENAAMMVETARIAWHMAAGTLAEMTDELRGMAGLPWSSPAGGTGFLFVCGDREMAGTLLRRVTVADIAADSEYLCNLWGTGTAAAGLGDAERLREAYDALRPYPGIWLVDGVGGGLVGVGADSLGRFAAALGHVDDARRWLTEALAAYRAAGAVPLTRSVETALAGLGRPATAPAGNPAVETGELVREGRTWRVTFRARTATAAHSKGLADIAALLAAPGREIHVLDLVDATGTARAVATGTGEVLDATARAAYRRRLGETAAEIAEAEAANDLGRAERLRAEQEFIAAELAAGLGLHGRARTGDDPVERARKAVTMRIGTALRALDDVHPALARHLRLAVSTGRFCAYRPEQLIRWRVREN